MINFENLDKAIFPGVGKYGIPEIAPTTEYPAGEFIPMNYAMSCKNPEGKILHSLWMITNLLGFGIRQTDIFLCCLGSPPCAHRIFHIHRYATGHADLQPLSETLACGVLAGARAYSIPNNQLE